MIFEIGDLRVRSSIKLLESQNFQVKIFSACKGLVKID